MDLQKLRIALVILGIIFFIFILVFQFDYSDPSYAINKSNYNGMLVGIMLAVSSYFSYRKVEKEGKGRLSRMKSRQRN